MWIEVVLLLLTPSPPPFWKTKKKQTNIGSFDLLRQGRCRDNNASTSFMTPGEFRHVAFFWDVTEPYFDYAWSNFRNFLQQTSWENEKQKIFLSQISSSKQRWKCVGTRLMTSSSLREGCFASPTIYLWQMKSNVLNKLTLQWQQPRKVNERSRE